MNPYRLLNLQEGEVHILRNAGGVVTDDMVRSLLISQKLLNTTEILIIQHTRCGMVTFNDSELKDEIERETGTRPEFDLGAFEDVFENVEKSVRLLRRNQFLTRSTEIRGFVYDVDEDILQEVKVN